MVGDSLAAMQAASQSESAAAALSTDEISSPPRIKQGSVNPPSVPKREQVAPRGPVIVQAELGAA